jgi:hypothetical protein
MDSNGTQVVTEAGFEKRARSGIQRLPRGLQHIMNNRGRCIRACCGFASLNPRWCPLHLFFFTVGAFALQQRDGRISHAHDARRHLISFTLVVIICPTDGQTGFALASRTSAAAGTLALQEGRANLVPFCHDLVMRKFGVALAF